MSDSRSPEELRAEVRRLGRAIRSEPDNVGLLLEMGDCYRDMGDLARERRIYDRIIGLNPDDTAILAAAYYGRGSADFRVTHNHGRAIEDYNEAITLDQSLANRLDANYAAAYFNRGVAYGNRGEHDLAIFDFTEAIRLNPDYAVAYNNIGFLYNAKGEYDSATRWLDQAVALAPGFSLAYINRGIAYRAIGDIEAALDDFDAAVRLCPDYLEQFIASDDRVIGGIEMREKAKELLDSLIARPPESAFDYYYTGVRMRYDNVGYLSRELFEMAWSKGFRDEDKLQEHLDSL